MAHFDRAIPPGGEGKITLTVDLRGYNGPVRKDATVTSNDPEKSSLKLTVMGHGQASDSGAPGNESFPFGEQQIRPRKRSSS